MNTYKTTFFSVCPANGVRISYELTIHTGRVIRVEDILHAVGSHCQGYHEDIADDLQSKLGGTQVLRADHHGVQIETTRPHLAHWSKPEPGCHSSAPIGAVSEPSVLGEA